MQTLSLILALVMGGAGRTAGSRRYTSKYRLICNNYSPWLPCTKTLAWTTVNVITLPALQHRVRFNTELPLLEKEKENVVQRSEK